MTLKKGIIFLIGILCSINCKAQSFLAPPETEKQVENALLKIRSQGFCHPGLLQNEQDLAALKKNIFSGSQSLRTAFEKVMQLATSADTLNAVVHVSRGTGGRLSKGGNELLKGSKQAYASAMLWYLTREKKYADKAIKILNQWSSNLWDFEGNDAILLAAWTGHVFANAAELLKYSASGWQSQAMNDFEQMLLTVYYPLLKNYFPEANGNWDAAIINTLMCIGIYCDRYEIFNDAVNHFVYGNGNGSLTRYIYPSGQCQESNRDQGHTQLGMGEFSEVCQVAWTQGVDLYSIGNNRLALGLEYTAKYMLGNNVPYFGKISEEERGKYRSIYESAYWHYYNIKELEMPFTKQALDSAASKTGLEKMSSFRAYGTNANKIKILLKVEDSSEFGARILQNEQMPTQAIKVLPGQNIQEAVNKALQSNGIVWLAKGLHTLSEPLVLQSGTTIIGEGRETVLYLDPKVTADIGYAAIINGTPDLKNIILRDFVVEGAISAVPFKDPNHDRRLRASQLAPTRAGILLLADKKGQMENIEIRNVTVQHCTHNGVSIKGAGDVRIINCDFSDNGGSVAPGRGNLHNLTIAYVSKGVISNNRLDDSPWGSGLSIIEGKDMLISNNEISRNNEHGISIAESDAIQIKNNRIESNLKKGIDSAKLFRANRAMLLQNNLLGYNGK